MGPAFLPVAEVALSGSLVADLGMGPEVWLYLTLMTCVVLFFKFGRFWSIRNLDLLLLFAPAPGLMWLVGRGDDGSQPWWAFVWLFLGSGLWLLRCLLDLGLTRRPILDPNLNAGGLACLICGMLGLLLVETVSLSEDKGTARNPADPHAGPDAQASSSPSAGAPATAHEKTVRRVLSQAPPPGVLKRMLAVLAHAGLVLGLWMVGWRHFERATIGLAMAACYVVTPYTRIALVDSGQLVPAALIVAAVLAYRRPARAGALIGLAGGWMPAALGLIPLWAGFYWGRGLRRFLAASGAVVAVCGAAALTITPLADWARSLGARSLAEAGMLPGIEAPHAGSFWTGVDPAFRLPVLIAYLAFALAAAVWPGGKNLAHLIALSAALLVAGQFWYLDAGGTMVVLYLPLVILMAFRPNLSQARPPAIARARREQEALFPVR